MRTSVLIVILAAGCAQAETGLPEAPDATQPIDAAQLADAAELADAAPVDDDSSLVAGGTFYRSFDLAGNSDMSFPATVSTFRLDDHEVTVARFRAFVTAGQGTQLAPPSAGAGAHPSIADSGWNPSWNGQLASNSTALSAALQCNSLATWTAAPGAQDSLPMMCLTWYEAMAFCAWDGGRLPTEAEWNYAASGGNEQRAYPWSLPAASVAIDLSNASFSCTGDAQAGCSLMDLFQVGSLPAGTGRWQQRDLAGSAWEWTLDAHATYVVPCVDCAQLSGAQRVLRGGGYQSSPSALRTAARNMEEPNARYNDVGVRCVRSTVVP